jgi:gamma-glutamylcysteine synthetase
MSDRLIFTLKHNGECLAYLYQNWGMGDGEEIERRVREAAKTYKLDLTSRADAIQAVRIAGEEQYGHAKWTANSDYTDAAWRIATARDRAYLDAHRDDIIADNQDEGGIVFFYGTYGDYPDYIDGWCEDAYTMTV